jgi:hypothetical protein
MDKKYKFLMGIKIVFGITAFVIVFGFGTMYLWNWLVPSLFHGPIINFYQTVGLLVLSKILFGGFGGKHYGGKHNGSSCKNRMRERYSKMSAEEKEQFKHRFKEKCRNKFWMNKEDANNKDVSENN